MTPRRTAPWVSLGIAILFLGTAQGAVMVRKAAWVTPGRVFSSIQAALNAAEPNEEVFVDATDGCEPVHLVKRVTLIGTGDIEQSDWSPGKSCISTLTFGKESVGSFVKGFVIGSIKGDSNRAIKISNCRVTGDIDIDANSSYTFCEGSCFSTGGEDFGINSEVDIGHNVLEGNVTAKPYTQYDSAGNAYLFPGENVYIHNNISHKTLSSWRVECNGGADAISGCDYPWPVWGPANLHYVAKTPRAYYKRADLDRAVVTQGEVIRVRFQGVMAPPQ